PSTTARRCALSMRNQGTAHTGRRPYFPTSQDAAPTLPCAPRLARRLAGRCHKMAHARRHGRVRRFACRLPARAPPAPPLRLPAWLRSDRPATPCGPREYARPRSRADLRKMRAALSFSQPTTPGKVVRCTPPLRPSAQKRDRPLPGRARRRGDRAGGDPPARCRPPALRDLDNIMKASASTACRRKPVLTPDQTEARKLLRQVLRRGTKVYTIQRH